MEQKLRDYNLPISFKSSSQYQKPKATEPRNPLPNIITTLFTKQFEIENKNCQLPAPNSMFTESGWTVDELQRMKNELNTVKSQLNDYNLAKWRIHTRKQNKAGAIKWKVRNEINPEFLTQAWCKFYEIVSSYPLVSKQASQLRTIHLCEAPGAFVASLNHWLKLNTRLIHWEWVATTLNPYYEGNSLSCMINDDRFMLHTLSHWYFGADSTGNLMSLENLDDFVTKMAKNNPETPMLITADGSIDCLNDPAEQETIVSHLHYCETITALHLLNQHGNFLLKIFTIFEHSTVCLMYLLACSFEKIILKKPATSKEGNSEVYVVCLDFKGPKFIAPYLNVFRQHYETSTECAMFRKRDIPATFIEQIVNCGKFFKFRQCQVILRNISAFTGSPRASLEVNQLKLDVANYFVSHYRLEKIPESAKIADTTVLSQYFQSLNYNMQSSDSFNSRQQRCEMLPGERLQALVEEINSIPTKTDDISIQFRQPLGDLKITLGKAYGMIQSSKFCQPQILTAFTVVLSLCDILGYDLTDLTKRSAEKFISTLTPNEKYLIFDYSASKNDSYMMENVCKSVQSLQVGENLIFIGYSLMTQFNVGLVYVLSHAFQSVTMQIVQDVGYIINFNNYLNVKKIILQLEEIFDAFKRATADNCMVLSVVPINKLCDGKLYHRVMDMNHVLMKQFVNRIASCH